MTRQIKDILCKAQQRLKELCMIKQQPQEQLPQKSHEQGILQKHFHIDLLIKLCTLQDACH